MSKNLVIIRGGGDLATGTVCCLRQSGFRVIVLEISQPTVIRHSVAVAQCVFTGKTQVESVQAALAASPASALELAAGGIVPVLIDPQGESILKLGPDIVVDAILAKKNMGTKLNWAPIVIGLGPGFTVGRDVHAIVETKRGHYLGKVYYEGQALPDTGIPGEIGGATRERLVHSPAEGRFLPIRKIGDWVEQDEVLGYIEQEAVKSSLQGVLRGIINPGVELTKGMKIGDVDPRQVAEYCWSISDKARAIAGGVLEAILHLRDAEQ